MTRGPSAHLFWSELACNDGTPYPVAWRFDPTRALALAAVFERLRAELNEPLVVLSGYRTPQYNTQIGGARRSQHLEGRALDLTLTRGRFTVNDLWSIARGLTMTEPRLRGLGRYTTFVHIDVRPSPRLVVWDSRVDH
jgi:uncharacterized protein YcbK (DUF882 family)